MKLHTLLPPIQHARWFVETFRSPMPDAQPSHADLREAKFRVCVLSGGGVYFPSSDL